MSNLNAKSINVGRLNVTEDTMYHRGRKVKMLDEDASGNLCLFNDSYPNEPLEIGINICPGTTVVSRLDTDISATQIMSGALDVSGAIQLAFSPQTTQNDVSNNLGKIAFFPDSSNNYRFWCCEESRDNSGNVSNDVWRLLTSSFAQQAYWTQTGTNLYYVGGNVGIGTKTPKSKLSIADVSGALGADSAGLAIGNTYANNNLAPHNGMIVEGLAGIGTHSPTVALDVSGSLLVGNGILDSSGSAMIGHGNTMTGDPNHPDNANFIAGHDCSLNGWCCSALGRHCVVNFPSYLPGDQGVALGNYAYAGITGGTNIAFAVGAGEESQSTEPTASLNNNKFVIDVCGNVGIGNGSLHSANIDISGNRGVTDPSKAAVRMEYYNTNDDNENHGPFYMELGKDSTYPWPGHNFHRLRCEGGKKGEQKYAPLIFQVNSGNDVMILDSSSNVGIGTLEPTERLDVSGNVKIRNGHLDMSCNPITDVSGIFFCQDSSGIDMSCNPITDVSKISFCSNGGGIDMSCNPITDVSGIYFCDGSSFTQGNSLDISGDGISFFTKGSNVAKMTIQKTSGNMGIGTSAPTEKLDVCGNIILSKPGPKQLIFQTTGGGGHQAKITSRENPGGGIKFLTGEAAAAPSTKMVIVGNGNIGIGQPPDNNGNNWSGNGSPYHGLSANVDVGISGELYADKSVYIGYNKWNFSASDLSANPPGLYVNGDISGNSSLTLPKLEIKDKKIVSRLSDINTANIIIDPSNGYTNLMGDVRVQTPTKDTNPATKQYVDQTATGLKVQEHVSLATDASLNYPFSGTSLTVDGSANPILGSRILVKNQSDASQNGVWNVSSGTWTRSSDFASGTNVSSFYVFVDNGSANLHTGWVVDGTNAIVGPPTGITFNQFSSTGDIEAGNGLTKTGETLNITACDGNDNYTINGGSINGTTIGATNAAPGTFTTLEATTSITGTLTTAAQPNITSVGTLGSVDIDGGAIDDTPIGSSTASTGKFTTLEATTSITGTLSTAAQPNITSVGTLTGLTVSSTIAGSVNGSSASCTGNAATATTAGTVTTAAQPNITSVGTLTGLTVSSTIAGSVNGSSASCTGNAATATTAGTVTAAAQPNITSVGTLTTLDLDGDITFKEIGSSTRTISVEQTAVAGDGTNLVIKAGQARDSGPFGNDGGDINIEGGDASTSNGDRGDVNITGAFIRLTNATPGYDKFAIILDGNTTITKDISCNGDISCNAIKDASGNIGNSGQVLSSTGTGLSWVNTTEHGPWSTSGSDIYYNATGGKVGIGKTDPSGALDVSGTVTATSFNATSDLNKKENIDTILNATEKMTLLRGVSYNLKSDKNKKKHYGVIAQELEKIFPDMVNGEEGNKSVAYMEIIGVLIETVKDLNKRIENLEQSSNN